MEHRRAGPSTFAPWRSLALASAAVALAASATARDPEPLAPITRDTPIADVIARTNTDYDYPRDDCVAIIDQALWWHPGDAALFERRAVCLVIGRRTTEALASAEAAAAADPTRATAWLLIGDAMRVRNPKRAVAAFRAYLAIPRAARGDVDRAGYDPDFDPERLVRAQLGLALLRLDRRDEAIVELERAREDIPVRHRRRIRARVQVSVARGLCLAYALGDDVRRGLLFCEQLDAKDRGIADGTLPYALARLFLAAGDLKRATVAATAFAATRRGLVIPPETLADPAALATWLRDQPPPIPR